MRNSDPFCMVRYTTLVLGVPQPCILQILHVPLLTHRAVCAGKERTVGREELSLELKSLRLFSAGRVKPGLCGRQGAAVRCLPP
ncbi:hypothetical protein AAY473_002102 [Plecturocebus cupreus]